MPRLRTCLALIASVALVGACGSDSSGDGTTVATTTTTTAAPTTAAPTTTAPSTATPPTAASTTAAPSTQPSTTVSAEIPPAIWPTADVVFTTPEAAATDFLAAVFGDGPMLGEFRAGDSRSGEIEVFASADGVPIGQARSVLMLRQLGPDDGWFVLSAASEVATAARHG